MAASSVLRERTAIRWRALISPTAQELRRAASDLDCSLATLEHALDPNERPRVQRDARSLLVIVPAPSAIEARSPAATTVPIGIVLTPNEGIVICRRDSPLVRAILAAVDGPNDDPHRAVIRALDIVAGAFLGVLQRIDEITDGLENRLRASLENREVLELLRYQKKLVHLAAVLDAMHVSVEKLAALPEFGAPALASDLEDVRVEVRQAFETSCVQRDVMSEMMDAFASIISNNLNVVMKFLAAATVILTFPITVASFYGMNVPLPGQRSPYAFAYVVALSVVLATAVAGYFWRRRWV
jgi:magnesium transporter